MKKFDFISYSVCIQNNTSLIRQPITNAQNYDFYLHLCFRSYLDPGFSPSCSLRRMLDDPAMGNFITLILRHFKSLFPRLWNIYDESCLFHLPCNSPNITPPSLPCHDEALTSPVLIMRLIRATHARIYPMRPMFKTCCERRRMRSRCVLRRDNVMKCR